MTEEEQIIKDVFEKGWKDQDFGLVSGYIADNAILRSGEKKREMNAEIFKQVVKRWKKAFPDLYFDIISLEQQGSYWKIDAYLVGTQNGEWREITQSFREIRVPHRFYIRLRNDQIVEVVEFNDFSGIEKYLEEGGDHPDNDEFFAKEFEL